MADINIHSIPGTLAEVDGTDYIVVNEAQGGGVYTTKKFLPGTMTNQDADSVAITGGTVNGVTSDVLAAITDVNVADNRKAPSQAIVTTYAASGSTGIQVADDAELNMGTGDFTLVWEGSLPDWTSTLTRFLSIFDDNSNLLTFYVDTVGKFTFLLRSTGATSITRVATTALTLADNSSHRIVAVVTRETSVIDGSISFFVNDSLFETMIIPAGTPPDFSFTTRLDICGYKDGGIQFAAQTQFAAIYNRALTAAEVADLGVNGIAEADKFGSQTPVYESDFSAGVDGFTGNSATLTGNIDTDADAAGVPPSDDYLRAVLTGGNRTHLISNSAFSVTANKKYRLSLTYFIPTNPVLSSISIWVAGTNMLAVLSAVNTETNYEIEFTPSNTGTLLIYSASGSAINDDGAAFYVKNIDLTQLGATWAISAQNAQPAPGQIFDITGNGNHALMPAAGASLKLPKYDFEFRSVHTWTASAAQQYIGGFAQEVLTAKHYIAQIISKTTETTSVQNLLIGDEADNDRYVTTAAAGTAADPVSHTLAKNIPDGTNLEFTITPAASATMTVEIIVRGFILES